MNRIYEELFIVRPDTPDEQVDGLVEQLTSYINSTGGTVDKSEKWGIRKLAYRVEKQTEGLYVLMQFTAGANTVKEVQRRLRVADPVMKFLTVRIDEKMKRIEKRKKAREKRAARKPAPQAAAPSLPAAEPAPVPGAPAPAVPAPAGPMPGAPAAPAEAEQE